MQVVEVERLQPRLLSMKGGGSYAAFGEWKLRRLVYAGKLTPYCFPGGKQLYVSKDELDRLIDDARGKRPAVPCQEREAE